VDYKIRHVEKRTVLMVPENMVTTLIERFHGDMFYGHESKFKTIEKILQSYWWRAIDQDITEFLAKCDKFQKTKKT
jgi:hypothetical protein